MYIAMTWKTNRMFRELSVVNLESINEGLEDFNEAMEWDAEDRIYEFRMELDEEIDGNFFCQGDFCYGYYGVWVHHCPDCGGQVEQDDETYD